jgi:hypothetical protein
MDFLLWKPQSQSALISFVLCSVCWCVWPPQHPMWPTVKSSRLVTLKGGPVSSVGKIDMCRQSRKRSSELDTAGSSSPLPCHLYFHPCLFASRFALAVGTRITTSRWGKWGTFLHRPHFFERLACAPVLFVPVRITMILNRTVSGF